MYNFGSLMTVAMIYGFAVSYATYLITVWRGDQIRMSGSFAYDFFMGAALNPRIGSVDLKMWAEVRVPWMLLFLIALSGACKQYEEFGYVSPVNFFRTNAFLSFTLCVEHGVHGPRDGTIHQCLVRCRRVVL
jgi:delta24(24(1))-sterol reductase